MEQFRRMLVSKLRVVFENASGELELWNKTASQQVDSQLRERRRNFRRRREALERIQNAAGELEQRITEIEAQDQRVNQLLARVSELGGALRAQAAGTAAMHDAVGGESFRLDLELESAPAPLQQAQA